MKLRRDSGRKRIPLHDTHQQPFSFIVTDEMHEKLDWIAQHAGGILQAAQRPISNDDADRYVVRSLIEESITSSQIEGAVTTRRIAKDMIRSGRQPRDTSEQMILNNYAAMRSIADMEGKTGLTPDIIFALHRTLVENTLEDSTAAGRFRRADERIDIVDAYGEVMHDPPPADELPSRLNALCQFANAQTPGYYIHPVVRSIILHFWLAYDHPFVDGNGRCARALFYWSMLRHDYWMCEYISISEVIRKARTQYGLAFLHTETDDNDLTYFIAYHIQLIEKAVRQLLAYVQRKQQEQQAVENLLRSSVDLNHRQQALLSHALRHANAEYTVQSHQTSHNIVYETARQDLLDLAKRGLLTQRKIKRLWHFHPADHLEEKLRQL
ncbi:MAG: Fic family protein [Phycisphaeraceae bacterium]